MDDAEFAAAIAEIGETLGMAIYVAVREGHNPKKNSERIVRGAFGVLAEKVIELVKQTD
jgi:hypothetical protein